MSTDRAQVIRQADVDRRGVLRAMDPITDDGFNHVGRTRGFVDR